MVKKIYAQTDMRKYIQTQDSHTQSYTYNHRQTNSNDQVQKECKGGRMRIIKDFECRTNYSCGRMSNCTFTEQLQTMTYAIKSHPRFNIIGILRLMSI